jgi:LacI family transcriptional regulator
VHTRLSTDTLAISDPVLEKAICFIRENAHRPIQVADVVNHVQLSRRSLERRFESAIGRSPAREIQLIHLQRAKKLLRETNMCVADVAARSGYCSAEYMSGIFRKATGRTPLKYQTWIKTK